MEYWKWTKTKVKTSEILRTCNSREDWTTTRSSPLVRIQNKNTKQFEKKSIIYGIDIDVNYGIDIDNGCLGEYGTRLKREKREKRLKKRLRIRFQTQQQIKESKSLVKSPMTLII